MSQKAEERGDLLSLHGFAFDRALEALSLHPSAWPVIKELTSNKPRLTSGALMINRPNKSPEPLRLHCAREDHGWESIRYETRDGHVYCNNFVVFPYLTDVHPGDGGLLVVPGSHKSAFLRPLAMFNNGIMTMDLAPGVVNVTPKAGDIVVMSEAVVHGALPWRPTDRERRILTLRYATQYDGEPAGGVPDQIKARLAPETQELIERGAYTHMKTIAKSDVVRLS